LNPPTPETTEAELAHAREQLRASVSALNQRLGELRDWRSWIRRHPWPFVTSALGIGVLLGLRRR
jgi:ElaB/YqjD/DUF883 family membrane-anchored ribosome-binding protein